MTPPPLTTPLHPGRHEAGPDDVGVPARIVESVVGVALVVAAAALALSGAPTPLRALLVLPVVIGVAGRGATILLFHRRLSTTPAGKDSGPEPGSGSGSDSEHDSAPDAGDDAVLHEQTLRAVAPVLFGVIATLAAILAVSALRQTITTSSVTVACAVVAAILHVAAALTRREAPPLAGWRGRAARAARVAVPALAALALLVVAVAGARAIEAERVEHYTQLSLVDPGVYATGGLRSAPGARFQVAWVMRAYAMPLADTPPVSLTVAGAAPTGLQQRALPPSTDVTEADASRRGLVSALAPGAPGLYRLALTVGAGEQAQTLYLVLEVAAP